MFKDGPKRQGRFIKHTNKIVDNLVLAEFNFEEICDRPLMYPDNPSNNIYIKKLHHEQDINVSTKYPPKFDEDLTDPSYKRPVLQPIDFTQVWEIQNSKSKQRKRSRSEDGEEEEEIEVIEVATQIDQDREVVADSKPNAVPIAKEVESKAKKPAVENQKQESQKAKDPVTIDESMAIIGKAIKDFSSQEIATNVSTLESQISAKPDHFVAIKNDPEQSFAEQEKIALAESRRKQLEEEISPEKINRIKEEAKAKGYQEGFEIGEEKAALQVRQTAHHMFSKVQELIGEFGNLKKEVLENIQANFYELAQAMGEALLQREFKMDPAAFANVMRRAIMENVSGDKFKIKVNSETYEILKNLDIGDLGKSIVKDDSVSPWDFRLESDLSIVDANVKKLVTNLIEQANIQLFEDEEKAS